MIDKDGVRIGVSVDGAKVAPAAKETPIEDNRTPAHEEKHAGDMRLEEENVASVLRKFALYRLARHGKKADNVKYIIRWYGYTLADDIVKLRAHIPEHFVTQHWRQSQKKETR